MTIRETIASVQHDIWAHWMEHLFTVGFKRSDGAVILDCDCVANWRRQMSLPYKDLYQTEQGSNRHQADKVIDALIRAKHSVLAEHDGYDWSNKLPGDVYHRLTSAGWPGWDKENGMPLMQHTVHIHGFSASSHQLAVQFDGACAAQFWYRDITNSGLPFVHQAEKYRAVWVFQIEADHYRFRRLFEELLDEDEL